MKVTHLVSGDLWAGAEVATTHLISFLGRTPDVSVQLIALNEGEMAQRVRAQGVKVKVIPESECSFSELVGGVRRETSDSDLVHSHRYKENVLAALSGRPWVATQHGLAERMPGWKGWKAGGYGLLSLACLGMSAGRAIAVSAEIQEWLERRIPRRKVELAHNGIRDPIGAAAIVPWGERPLVVGLLGRLFPVKGMDLAIAALARCPEVRLEIIGDGPLREELEVLCGEMGVRERVLFLGHLSDPLPHVARWRALLVTSLHEGNPIAVVEALALGTPILGGAIRGLEETLGGKGGWLVGSRDPAHWARELRARLGDAEGGSEASRTARERFLEEFTGEASASRIGSLYREVLQET